MNSSQLRDAIIKIAAIEAEGLLDEVHGGFRHECKALGGGPPVSEWRDFNARTSCDVDIDLVARVASSMLNRPLKECEAIACEEFRRDEYTETALRVINDVYATLPPTVATAEVPRAPQPASRLPSAEEDRLWNPTTGGPATEEWERKQAEQKQTSRGRKW